MTKQHLFNGYHASKETLDLSNMKFENVYFINGMAYAGNFMVKALANKYNGIACKENYYDTFIETLNSTELPGLTYTRDGLLK